MELSNSLKFLVFLKSLKLFLKIVFKFITDHNYRPFFFNFILNNIIQNFTIYSIHLTFKKYDIKYNFN